MNKILKGMGTGHGETIEAGEQRRRRVIHRLTVRNAHRLERFSEQLARFRAYRQGAFSGRPVSKQAMQELEGIFHAGITPALLKTGTVVTVSRLFRRVKDSGLWQPSTRPGECNACLARVLSAAGPVNPYRLSVRLAWVRAIKAAHSLGVASVRSSAISEDTTSLSDLVKVREHLEGNWGEVRTYSVEESPVLISGHGARRKGIGATARQLRHAKESLVTFWSLSGSQRWQGALKADLLLLAQCAKVARGVSSKILGDYDTFNQSAKRYAMERLIKRIAAGDLLATNDPEKTEEALATWARGRKQNA